MKNRMMMALVSTAGALSLSACASNYAAEGAGIGAAAGAVISAVSGGDALTGAAVGAAAGGAGGALIRKDSGCYRLDRYGRERRVRCR
jgi:hypothetical protein